MRNPMKLNGRPQTPAQAADAADLQAARAMERDWETNPRWAGVRRPYAAADVIRLRGTVQVEHTLARRGAEKLHCLLTRGNGAYVNALGAMTGGQAMQQARAGLRAVYLSGWQVAADNNLAGQMYPDQSLYPANSAPELVRRINNTLLRADQIARAERTDDPADDHAANGANGINGGNGANDANGANGANGVNGMGGVGVGGVGVDWLLPIVADAEAGFGGPLNAFELMKAMIEAGAAGVHYEDQLASAKKCGHMGGKVLVPTSEMIAKLTAARLAADVAGVPTLLFARTDAEAATLLTSDADEYDAPFVLRGEPRTPEGFHRARPGLAAAIHRGLAYAPCADLLWCETKTPDLDEARKFAEGIHARFPGKPLAYNCSPSFNWRRNLPEGKIAAFQRELGAMGYCFQFITLAGFHSLNHGMFDLARRYRDEGMPAFVDLQEREFASAAQGFTAARHQREVGAGYFDEVARVVSGGLSSVTALAGSTEEAQFAAGERAA